MDLGAPFFCIGIYLYTSYRILEKDSYYYTWRKVFMKEKTPSKAFKNAGSVLWSYLQKTLFSDFTSFFKWLLISLLCGIVIGAAGTAFHFAVSGAEFLRGQYHWLFLFLPVGGLCIAFLYCHSGMENDAGTDMVLFSVRSETQISWKTAPLIFISTVITHLLGGSAGREGAALQLGGSLGQVLGRRLHLDIKDMHIITLCGMSAGFAALFGTPMTAAIFAMEVISVGVMYYAALVPCVLSAIIASQISSAFGSKPTSFLLPEKFIPDISPLLIVQVVVLSAFCALLSIAVCLVFHKISLLYRKYLPNLYLRSVVGGALVALLMLLLQTTDYLGAGMSVIQNAINGQARPEAFILKTLLTALTLGAGFKGGEIVPSFFIGATFGCTISTLLGLPPELAAALGLVALFCGVTNCPIASFILSLELFGGQGCLFFLLAVSISYTLSGYYGLYSKQKILYSKTRPVFIDTQTK